MTQGTNLKYNSPKFLDDYVGVDELIEQMNEKYPTGHLITEVLDMSDTHVVFKASFLQTKMISLQNVLVTHV